MTSPRHGFEALRIDFFSTTDALPETAFADAGQRTINHHEQLPVIVALAEQKLLVVGTGGTVGNILGRVFVGRAPIDLIPVHRAAQVLLPRLQTFLERLYLFLFHNSLQIQDSGIPKTGLSNS